MRSVEEKALDVPPETFRMLSKCGCNHERKHTCEVSDVHTSHTLSCPECGNERKVEGSFKIVKTEEIPTINMTLVSSPVVATKPWTTQDAPMWLRWLEHIIRTKVFGQRRYLLCPWIISNNDEKESDE